MKFDGAKLRVFFKIRQTWGLKNAKRKAFSLKNVILGLNIDRITILKPYLMNAEPVKSFFVLNLRYEKK